ncbi:7641_t:CDS:2, partial [Dentiscutata erythropus]
MVLSRTIRIYIVIFLTGVFFFAEIIIGYWTNSLALVTDSFHMLNDLISYLIALYAFKLASATTSSSRYSYGRQRAEVLGGFINGVLLLSLCLNIFIEAIQRFFVGQEHSHHGHSHSQHLPSTTLERMSTIDAHEDYSIEIQERDETNRSSHEAHAHKHENSHSHLHDNHSHKDHNMKGVFLHVLGDALGNIGVIASALFIRYTNFEWRHYADPAV